MSIWTTPEREQLRKTVRSFAEREILPHVDEWEHGGELPRALHRAATEADRDWYEHLFILGDDHYSAAGNRFLFLEIARHLL